MEKPRLSCQKLAQKIKNCAQTISRADFIYNFFKVCPEDIRDIKKDFPKEN